MAVTTSPDRRPPPVGLPRPEELDPSRLAVGYDRTSDILLVHFGNRGRFGVVDYVGEPDYLAVLRDVEGDDVVGLQIEDFLARAIVDDPTRLDLLEVAELRGITPDEVGALRAEAARGARKRSAVADLLRALEWGERPPAGGA
ncbi:MAG: hypothetical protein M3Q10_17195 [Chloroflexota bacterium]|nr:hypothetical protein [Chloroflexota bacterium]